MKEKQKGRAHTMGYHPAFKRKVILSHAAPRMTLEDMMLSKKKKKKPVTKRQTPYDPLHGLPREVKSGETEVEQWLPGAEGRRKGVNKHSVSVLCDEKVLYSLT